MLHKKDHIEKNKKHTNFGEKISLSHIKKTIQTFIILSLLSGSVAQGQITKKITVDSVGLQEKIEILDTLNHKTILITPIDKILEIYGEKKGYEIIRQHMIQEVNTIRKQYNSSPLRLNDSLNISAQSYAQKLSDKDRFSHKDSDGSSSKSRIQNVGFINLKAFTFTGENLAKNDTSIQEVIGRWMDSPPHKKALLLSVFSDFGLGYYKGYRVQHFGGL